MAKKRARLYRKKALWWLFIGVALNYFSLSAVSAPAGLAAGRRFFVKK